MGLFDFFKKNKTEIKTEQSQPIVDEAQADFINSSTENAERMIEAFNDKFEGAFDYSEKSLVVLDKFLDNMAEFFNQMDEEMKSDLIAQAGSYIFEVARRTYGGKYYWYEQFNQPIFVTGQPNFEISFLAFEKVKGRLENGAEDNIPFFFQGYVERVRNAKIGDKAMIV